MTTVFNAVQADAFTRGDGTNPRKNVRVATTASVSLASNFVGSSIDGVTLAAGDRILIKNQALVSQAVTVTTIADSAGTLAGVYFFISSPTVDYYVWFFVGGFGTDPLISGRTGIQVTFALNASANTVATAVAAALDVTPQFAVPVPGANTFVVTNAAAGYSTPATAQSSGFTVTNSYGSGSIDHGIYIVGSGANATYRAPDLVVGDSVVSMYTDVSEGTVGAATSWVQITTPCTVGVNTQQWNQRGLFVRPVNTIQYADTTSTIANIPTAASSLMVTSAGGVPSFSNALPAGTTASPPSAPNDVATKAYVDSAAAGLDPKESVRLRTIANIGGTYNATGGTTGTGAFTGVNLTNASAFDLGPTLLVGNRVLIMNQSDPKQNGIYVVTIAGVSGAIERAADQSTVANTSGGNYTFVETGAVYQSTGWVVQGDGALTPNTNNIIWVQFSAAGSFNALNGITIVGADISADLFPNGGIVFNGTTPNGQLQVNLSASSISGTVDATHGGTGFTTYSPGDILVGNGLNTLTPLNSFARKVLTTDNSNLVDWRNTVHLDSIRGSSANQPLLVQFTNTNSAQNYITIANSLPTVEPTIASAGSDTNISLSFAPKGTGAINIRGDTNSGEIRLWNSAGTFYAGLRAAAMASNITWTWPQTDGSSGDVMRTNGAGVLSFANATATARMVMPVLTAQATANVATLTAVAYFNWDYAELSSVPAAKLFYNTTITGGKTLEVQVWNETTNAQLGIDSQTASGFYKFSFTLPGANARLSIRIRKTVANGASPNIFGAAIILNSQT